MSVKGLPLPGIEGLERTAGELDTAAFYGAYVGDGRYLTNITLEDPLIVSNIQVLTSIKGSSGIPYTVDQLASGGIADLLPKTQLGASEIVVQDGGLNNVITLSNMFVGTTIYSNIVTEGQIQFGPYSVYYESSNLIFSKNGSIYMILSDD